ncbi:glycosyltransferase family 2 protein [Neokomagataea anthophila]|uniref:Glycosyltransferase family 2 protein n=1 Tax=Neokomagataea anthophila TaxID=2826925 RepID=A0ABS5E473_9PROT|nr:glycosyltransferase family 2 protein [Neokomagataea anthophila]MBR0558705.1 glycosyltransferase family 2 protein [Neokomagataea anthophila]
MVENNSKPQISSIFRSNIDKITNGTISGWAFDTITLKPVTVHILIDQQEVLQSTCNEPRIDVQNAFQLPHENHGINITIPPHFHDGQPHTLSLRLPDRSPILLPLPEEDATPSHDEITFQLDYTPEIVSHADGITHGAVRGWALQRLSPSGDLEGDVTVSLLVDGRPASQARANLYRGDVAAALGCSPNCGFELPIPLHFRGSAPHHFEVITLPNKLTIPGTPIISAVTDDALETRLVNLINVIDGLHRELSTLRKDVRSLIPKRPDTLRDYDRWARRYYPMRRVLAAQERDYAAQNGTPPQPLVSVLCPTYRPLKSDFEAAIQSVLNQTYSNWELIIIDDCGKSAETTKTINSFAKQDERIRPIILTKNAGISNATNVGMDAAQGQYVVFFDHDDLMEDIALEVMVRAAQKTGAKLIYSDEDKIDQAGYYLEPNFKPDFNYRYLLGCNYICHLTMIDTETMRKVGHLSKQYDGAQDHDFVLRATEILTPDEIHHVPELLYHWRKTPNSTAVTVANKTYAVDAGVRCVKDHLTRKKHKVKVSSINNLTVYRAQYTLTEQPEVTIIIPFRDQVETTRQCVDALLQYTSYKNFKIILVDNWSTEKETLEYLKEIQKNKKISTLRIEEPFNYSLINNKAVSNSTSPFILFLNNDVFVEQKNWLNIAMSEALAAPDIGAVGLKLLYPNNTVQHAGVAVGAPAVAVHTQRGIAANDYGYIGRAMLTHEVTAVTAAAMLVRKDVFDAVGGFDDEHLTVAYNDVDLCLKIRKAGYRIIFSADSIAVHHESLSRGSDDRPEHETRFFLETQTMLTRWEHEPLFKQDPAYSRFFRVDQQPFFELEDPETLTSGETTQRV